MSKIDSYVLFIFSNKTVFSHFDNLSFLLITQKGKSFLGCINEMDERKILTGVF